MSTVLAAMDVDVSDPARALAAREDARWARMLPPSVVVVSGEERTFARARHGRRPGRGDARARGRRPARPEPGSTTGCSRARVDGRSVGRGDVRGARRTCRWATTACGPAPAAAPQPRPLIVTPAWLGLPDRSATAALGSGRPSSTASARAQLLGRRRPRRPDRPRRLVRRRARRRLRAGQPAARRRAGRADGAVAVPAHVAPLRQPALPAGRADPGVRRPAGRRPRDGRGRCAPSVHARLDAARRDRPGHRVDRQARRAAARARGTAQRRPRGGLRRVPAPARRGAARLRRPGARSPRSTAPTGAPGRTTLQDPALPRGGRVRAPSTQAEVDFHALAAVGARRAARSAPRRRRVGAGMALGIDARPRRRRAPARGRRVARCRTTYASGIHGRRPAGPVQPDRARTGASRRGGPTGWRSSATRRSAT